MLLLLLQTVTHEHDGDIQREMGVSTTSSRAAGIWQAGTDDFAKVRACVRAGVRAPPTH